MVAALLGQQKGTIFARKMEKSAHLRQLPPVQMMPGVELEDEDIVDLGLRPQATGETEE